MQIVINRAVDLDECCQHASVLLECVVDISDGQPSENFSPIERALIMVAA